MDPLSAVSLAGNVVQFLEFGVKLISKTHEIYKSGEGAEIRNIELDAIANDLVALNDRVRNRSRKVCEFAISEDEKSLQALTEQCNRVGDELISALESAKVQQSRKMWKSVRQALKSVLGRDRIAELYHRLKQYREQIVVVLLVINNARQTAADSKVEEIGLGVVSSEKRILDETRQARFQILDAISRSNYSPAKPEDVATVSALLSEVASFASEKQSRENVLESLYYPRMGDRREWISSAHRKTFNWALEHRKDDTRPWDDLKEWLLQGNGIYWLSGKAGSGKSTLMKYIDQDERTTQFLREWVAPMDLLFARFYFWNPGTTMQKSQKGLLQSLLYEIFTRRPSLIPTVLPSLWNSPSGVNRKYSWTTSELVNAFQLLADTQFDTKFCFLIDGLDEFDGDHQVLIDMLCNVSRNPNIKILAASRPWLVFQDAFQDYPKLALQDLTRGDIQVFADDSLYNHPRFSRLLSLEPERAPQLVREIVDKASGVFLWVYLVVRSLLEGLTNADRMADLQRRLKELPMDLEQYFLHILTSLNSFYLQQASQLFRLALEAPRPLEVLTFSYLDEDDPDFALRSEIKPLSNEEESIRCEDIERRLNSRCKGLLESRRRQACDEYSTVDGVVEGRTLYEVDFLHRTVRDFLMTPTVHIQLVAQDTADFDANMALARAYVAQIKGLRRASHSEANFQALWSLVFSMLYHIGRVSDSVSPQAQVDLLEEMDRAARVFRQLAIVKRRCPQDAHWVNTGYRFGFEPAWNNSLLTLCIRHGLMTYVSQRLDVGERNRSGRPLLAFAMMVPRTTEPVTEDMIAYTVPRVDMVKLILSRGASPNDLDEQQTIWARTLISIYTLAARSESGFSEQAKSWFQITKLMLLHGADSQAVCKIPFESSRLFDRVRVQKHQTTSHKNLYSALDIIHIVFGGDAAFDMAEVEDISDQDAPKPRSVSDSYLAVPSNVERSHSSASSASRVTAASWQHPTEHINPNRLLKDSQPASDKQALATVPVELGPDTTPRESKHIRISSWLKKKFTV
ncbi:hypothetical protein ASPVEDRAFT_45324 [Aspergillus versicolor CBS 583.65]|uniref:NACHT domain-containing protein n=1 Tax=Aspergillus versicolor CBS 583.65 TaxID=1036611 RepID=A0A1L9PWQ2_ASPVE|nr:uncharacterized protein ASPVEDRAFT_45324 [Aspergillus versicolor CBS 583.65]OJJ05862.1 hypothetical protein ASPVEDRAFT_45324 [Aspergillus versicolor CBS 583.65]